MYALQKEESFIVAKDRRSKNIEHPTSNIECGMWHKLRLVFFINDRIHYSMFNVGCSMFDVLSKQLSIYEV